MTKSKFNLPIISMRRVLKEKLKVLNIRPPPIRLWRRVLKEVNT